MAYSVDTSNIAQEPRPELASADKVRLQKSLSDAANRHDIPEDFSGRDLSGLDLTGCDLRNLNFSGADLSNTTLERANLSSTVFTNARLDNTDFRGATLHGTDFSKVKGHKTSFAGARARNARFNEAYLGECTFAQGDFTDADFRDAILSHAQFRKAILTKIDFSGALLFEADFDSAYVGGAIFDNADLREAHLRGMKRYKTASWISVDVRLVDFCGAYRVRRHIYDENYLHEFRNHNALNRVIFTLWWLTSDCGRSLVRWTGLVGCTILIFSALYARVDMNYGEYATDLSPVYYSAVTLTTLGYGALVPASETAQLLVLAESLLGYVALGGFLAIFANKMTRRAD